MQKLTKEQAIIISAYTGVLCCNFTDLHEYIEKVMGRPVFTHELGDGLFWDDLRDKIKKDFLSMIE